MLIDYERKAAMNPHLLSANELGIRLEIVGGIPLWEARPVYKHQKAVDRIRASIRIGEDEVCACVHVADMYIKLSRRIVETTECLRFLPRTG